MITQVHRAGYVAIVGRPNSGKSTLLNTILKSELSIVTPKAQTTRENVEGILTLANAQIVFTDTPGIHEARPNGLNAFMVEKARLSLKNPDVIWYLVDPDSRLEHEMAVIELLSAAWKDGSPPIFVLFNKCDIKSFRPKVTRVSPNILAEFEKRGIKPALVIEMSGRKNLQVEALVQRTLSLLPEGPAFYEDTEQLSNRPMRFFVAEKIREQLYLCLGEEVPYSCAVKMETFDENAKPPRIEATIVVERESQKGIVIGKDGAKVKEIGTKARITIEKLLEKKIFLGLKVSVEKDWSKSPDRLRELGYQLPPSEARA